jgi:hypothetical protein
LTAVRDGVRKLWSVDSPRVGETLAVARAPRINLRKL